MIKKDFSNETLLPAKIPRGGQIIYRNRVDVYRQEAVRKPRGGCMFLAQSYTLSDQMNRSNQKGWKDYM